MSSVPPELAAAIAAREGRLTDEIQLVLPGGTSVADLVDEARDPPAGVEVSSTRTGVGRGWGGEAEAIYIGVTGTVAVIQLAGYVMRVWKAIRRRSTEAAPTFGFSLGAAKYLCLADLASRRDGDIDGIELLWAGDVGQGNQHDVTHSGDDVFCLIFVRNDATWAYVIESTGGLIAFVEGTPLAKHTVNRLFGVGLDYEQAPDETTKSLGDEPD